MERRKRRPQKSVSETCPKCGYCDKCGRSNAAPVWPYVPYVPPTPVWPWQGPFPYAITVSGTSSAAAQNGYNPSVYNMSGLSFSGNDGLHVNTTGEDVFGSPNTQTNADMTLSN